jgi:Asp-tRNA(Asn)/Glu-tRNA(Gln) amidotransferase A subunit family amidase
MTPDDLPRLDELSKLIRLRATTPFDLAERCLAGIASHDRELRAWVHVAHDRALVDADLLTAELQSGGPRGPLHGIPFGVKDIFDTAGVPTCWGSEIYTGRTPSKDSALVALLRAAGAVMLGKTHTTAFAYFDPAPTRNPRNPEHTPGGSSSGSAAAVAAGMVPFALGSQTMGSVLRPAAFCGIAGFKPTFGKLPREGMLDFSATLDHPGLFTRTAEDMAFLWQAMGYGEGSEDETDSFVTFDEPMDECVEAETQQALRSAEDRLRGAGFAVDKAAVPTVFRGLLTATRKLMTYEGAQRHRGELERHGRRIGERLAVLIEEGLGISESEYRQSLAHIVSARSEFEAFLAGQRILLLPAAPGPAPRGLASTGNPCCNAPITALGAPAVSIPMGTARNGLPLGLQLVAGRGRDQSLLRAACLAEAALNR